MDATPLAGANDYRTASAQVEYLTEADCTAAIRRLTAFLALLGGTIVAFAVLDQSLSVIPFGMVTAALNLAGSISLRRKIRRGERIVPSTLRPK